MSEFGEWGSVIMVNTWFTWPCDDATVNNTEATVHRVAADGEAVGKCLTICVNKFRIQRAISSGYANFGYPDGKVVSYLFCKVSAIIWSWLIRPYHSKMGEQLGKWPVAILTGHWPHFTWSQTRGYISTAVKSIWPRSHFPQNSPLLNKTIWKYWTTKSNLWQPRQTLNTSLVFRPTSSKSAVTIFTGQKIAPLPIWNTFFDHLN